MEKDFITLGACRAREGVFAEVIDQYAAQFRLVKRSLVVRALLQAPRIATPEGVVPVDGLKAMVRNEAEGLEKDLHEFEREGGEWPRGADSVAELTFDRLEPKLANAIFGHLHYLHYMRPDSVVYGLFHPQTHQPLAACAVAPLQWRALEDLILRTTGVPGEAIMDVSRVYAFDQAPKNSISALLSRVRSDLRVSHPEVRLLSTAVDQNLGFTGSSYKASNWELFCTVQARPYFYVGSEFKTIRQLREVIGPDRWEALLAMSVDEMRELEGDHDLQVSEAKLLDSLIFVQPIRQGEVVLPSEVPHLLRGWSSSRIS